MNKPYYQDDYATLYHGDSREILPHLPKVDLVLTDPPYGLGKKLHDGGTWSTNEIYDDVLKWDTKPVELDLLLDSINKGDSAIVWGGNYFNLPPSRCWLAWKKREAMPSLADMELAWSNIDFVAKLFEERRNPDGKRRHPTQKPISLMSWCINLRGNVQTILDPFAGSGTTLLAAKRLGRKAIGIELEEKYCEIAANRLRNEPNPLLVETSSTASNELSLFKEAV